MYMVQTSSLNMAAFTPTLPLTLRSRHACFSPTSVGARPTKVSALRTSYMKLNIPGDNSNTGSHPQIYIATARAITPLRSQDEAAMYEEQGLPSQRSADLMAPSRGGFWGVIPYLALFSTMGFFSWIGWKRLRARQTRLVDEYGDVLVYYGTTTDSQRQITREYKRKLGPGILRGAMYVSFLRSLVTEKPVGPQAIQDAAITKRLLRLGDKKAVQLFNQLGNELKDSPSLLGKLLFLGERLFKPSAVAELRLTGLFPYGAGTVVELQRNMAERCFKDLVEREIEANGEDMGAPLELAGVLKIEAEEAQQVYASVIAERRKQRELEEESVIAAEAEDQTSKPAVSDSLDFPARSGEPAKVTSHAYECSSCGYTIFPAAGREFKFYGADFVCPACGATKDKFVDVGGS